jgi:uncharacterized protein (DUF4415 family)
MTKRLTTYRLGDPVEDLTNWERFDAITEEQIAEQAREDGTDYPEEFWANAVVVMPMKEAMSMRVDSDVLAWFRQGGRGYQTRMNAVLRRYMEAQQRRK